MGVKSYLVLWVFTDECCHPNRLRVELLLIEIFETGSLNISNRDTLKSIHCFFPNELELSFRLAEAVFAISGSVLIIKRKESRRLSVGCSRSVR